MSDSSENEEISSSLKKGKRKLQRIIEDSSSDSDSSIENNHRRKRILRVTSEADSSGTDSSEIIKTTHRKKKMRVSSSTSNDSYGDSDSESDWTTDSETEERKNSSKSKTEMDPGPSTSSASVNKNDDSSSDSDGQTEKCSICFGKFLNQEIGTPETCDHSFCAYCIQEWAKNVNTCPVDRQEFSLILVRRRLNDKIIRKIPVERRRLDGDRDLVENDPTFCEICGQSDREDRMLLCDGCDLGYHMECLDPPLETVPVEEWYCAECANAGPLADSVDIYPDEINALWDEILELGGRPTRRRRAAADQAMVRLIPRTRQSERVRITIEMNRERETANIQNQLANDGPSTSSGFESIADNSNPGTSRNFDNASAVTQRHRKPVTTKRKKKRKTRKRKKRQVTVEYEIDENSGVKFALKKKSVGRKRKRKTRRRKKARIIEPSRKTVKKRLADQLGMCSRKQASQVIPEIKVKTSQDAIGYQRSQAGIPTLHLFGRRDELDYFSEDSDNADEASIGFGLSLATRARQQLHGLSLGRQNRLKNVLMASPPPAATPCDILGSILDSQTKLHSKNAKLSVERDGTIKVENDNPVNTLINSNNNTKDPITKDKKVDVNSNENQTSVTQTPMYPGYGNGGNRPPYNFGRGNGTNGGYRGGYGGGYYSGNGPRGRGTGYGLHSFDAARDGRSGYMDYLHRGHRGGVPIFARGRGAPRFPRRQQQQNIEQPENLSNRPDENSPVEPNVQENEVSRSTVEPFADTSNANVNHSERFAEDDFDIYSDIESTSASKDENETSANEASASFSELMPPPIPPSLPGIVYGSDSDEKDSDTELIIDDTEKTEADKYDPADPSNDTDSEPDTTNTSAVAADNAVASTSTSQPLNMISSLKLTSSEDLRLQPETTSSSNVNNNVFPSCSSAIQEGQDEDDSDGDCPNFSIYSAEAMDIAKKTEVIVPVPSLPVEAESSGISADNSQSDEQAQSNDLEQAESNDNLEQVESNNLEQAESNNLEQIPEPDSIQNDEVESSTKDYETENQANIQQQEADSVNVQNEPDSNNMEKDVSHDEYPNSNEEMVPLDSTSVPEESGCRSENQSEEISTTQDDTEIDTDKVPTESSGTSTSTITQSTDKKVVVAFKPNHHRILQLYDDSDWEEWSSNEKSEGKEKSEEHTDDKPDDSETEKPAEANNSVMAEIEKLTEAVSEEERSYTPCQDENKHDSRKDMGIDGMDTELVSDEEKNDFDENHELKSDGEALEINAKESELELSVRPEEYEEGEIVEGGKKQKKQDESVTETVVDIVIDNDAVDNETKKKKEVSDKKKRDTGDKNKEKKKKVDTSFKKVSKNNKERNYRDKEKERDRSKSKEKRGKDGKENKNRKEKRKEKRKELERYDVRNIIGAKVAKKNFADAFGRNESRERSPSLTRHRSLSHGRRSTSRRRKSLSRPRRSLSRNRRSFSRRRRSLSRGKRSASRERRSLSRNKRSLSRTRRGRSRDRRSLSRGRRPRRSKSRSASFRLSRTLSRGRSRSHGRQFNRKSKSKSPRNRNKPRHFRSSSRDKSRVRQKSSDRNKLKKSKKKERTSQQRTHNRLSRSLSLTSRNPDPMEWDHQRYRRDWTPSWSRSPSPQLHHAISNVSPSWTPPIHRDNQNLTPQNLTVILTNNEALKKKKEKKKKAEKRAKEQSNDRRKRRRLDKTPPPSKEVFASGDNILVSVKFNKPQNEDGTLTPPVREVIGTKRKRDNMSGEPQKKSKKDKSGKDKRKGEKKKAKNKNKEVSNIKPVAIIDLDKSPFKELTPSPKDVIVLSDSDNGEKEAELMERQEMLREELLEMGSQEEIDSVPQSPRENNYLNATTGPKTPPEPQVKFLIQKPTQLLRNVSNPLHDEHEDNTEIEDMDPQEELEMRLNEVLHKGPNTPPEPPTSPPSSPDAYDPFEPTKSRSPTPELAQPSSPSASIQKCQSIPDAVESDASLADLAVCPLESSQKPTDSTENKTSPLERVVTLLSSKRVSSKSPEHSNRSPTPSQNVDQDNAQKSSSPEKNGEGSTIGVVINQTVQAAPKPITAAPTYSSAAATMITSTPVTQVVSSSRPGGVFSTITAPGARATSATAPQRSIVLPTSSKSSPIKPPPLKSSPTKVPVKISTPIKPMPKTIISKLPLPATKQYPSNRKIQQSKNTPPKAGGRTTGQNGNDVIDVDLDFDSPYSPGSSDYEDIFEPPPEPFYNTATSRSQTQKNTKKQNTFDTLFGGSPVYKPTPTNKKSKSPATKVPVKYNKKSVSKGGSKSQVGMKLDEDSLKILDDLPSSAVEMQVKDKFLKKLNRQERVVEEVKLVLKPHYNKKHITKEQYKDILRRAVPKICHNKTGEINPKKIQSLIEAYVKRARISNKKSQSSSAPVNSTTQPKTAAKTFWR